MSNRVNGDIVEGRVNLASTYKERSTGCLAGHKSLPSKKEKILLVLIKRFISLIFYLRKARKLSLAMGPSSPHSVYTSWVTLRLVALQRT